MTPTEEQWYSTELVICAPQPIMICRILCSWPHSGVAGAAGEVPGGPEEARPARGGTRAADGYLPAFSRYCRSDSAEDGTDRGVIMNCSWVISLVAFSPQHGICSLWILLWLKIDFNILIRKHLNHCCDLSLNINHVEVEVLVNWRLSYFWWASASRA